MSSNREDYISLFELLEWAKQHNNYDLLQANQDLLQFLLEKNVNIPTYTIHQGIFPRITKNKNSLVCCLSTIEEQFGYFEDIPF